MKRLAFFVIFFMMISSQAWGEYVTKQNFIHGTIGSDYIQTTDTVASTFTIVYGTNSNTMTGCTDANPCRIVVYDASCSQPSSCANREVMDIRTVSSLTFTIDARNAETPNCTSCTFAAGAKWAQVSTVGILSGLPLPTPTTGCVLQSTDGVNYSCPETLNVATINDSVEFTNTAAPTKKLSWDLSGITTGQDRVWTAQDKNCTPMCTVDTSFGGNAATATALAANPSESGCGAGVFATAIDASGNLTCTAQTAEVDPIVATQTNGFTITRGTTPKTLTVPLDASVSGTNTGDDDAPEAGDYAAASIDGDDINSNLAGRSLTLTAASPDTLDADAELYTKVKCINIDPSATTTNWFFFRAPLAITITGVDCIVDAATSVVMTPQECDANGANCVDIEAAITCATTNTTEASTVDNASIDAGDWINVTRGTKTGSPTQAVLCLEFTVND